MGWKIDKSGQNAEYNDDGYPEDKPRYPAFTQVATVQNPRKGTTISIHHEQMRSGDQRQAMHRHWSEVMDKLGELIKG